MHNACKRQASVAKLSKTHSARPNFLQLNQFIKTETSKPEAPAKKEEADITKPNWASTLLNICVNCGPSGIMTMKSTMCVNWMLASVRKSHSSRLGDRGVVMKKAASMSF